MVGVGFGVVDVFGLFVLNVIELDVVVVVDVVDADVVVMMLVVDVVLDSTNDIKEKMSNKIDNNNSCARTSCRRKLWKW